MKWFKFYGQDWLTDLKVMKMSMEDRLCFITLLCLASAADEDGLIRNCDEEAVIRLTNLPEYVLEDTDPRRQAKGFLQRCNALQTVTLMQNGDVIVDAFRRRQSENLSNAERQKNYRERLKTKDLFGNDSNVTSSNDSNARLDKSREEKNSTSFDAFWGLYPKKVEKRKAMLKWGKLPIEIQQRILSDLPLRSRSEKWLKNNGQFVENPTTYLNGERWNDEIKERVSGAMATVI